MYNADTMTLTDLRRLVESGAASSRYIRGARYSRVYARFAAIHGDGWDSPTLRAVLPGWYGALRRAAYMDAPEYKRAA